MAQIDPKHAVRCRIARPRRREGQAPVPVWDPAVSDKYKTLARLLLCVAAPSSFPPSRAIGDTALPLPCGGDSGDFVPSGGDSGVFVPRGGDSGVFVPRGGDSGVFVIPASSSGCLPSLLASPVVTRRSHTRARRPKSDGTNSPLPDGDDTLADDAISTLPDTEATSSAPATPQIPDSNAAASTLFERFVYISTGGSSMSGTGTSTLFLFLHVVSALLITAVKNPSIRKKVADQVGHRVRLSPSVLSVFVFSSAAIAFTYDAIKSGKELEGLGSYLLKITKTGKYSGCHQNIDKKQELNKETP
uniref:OSJNBa0063C18.12 protein n=1 Tax=Oryza sativa subsp. japonica TaxID=39947 RepID=Q7F9C5_ORYSJ|nr:OSJNBa0063C18.12 [Oryza sativa Japonica Group]